MMSPVDDKTIKRDIRDLVRSSEGLKAHFLVIAGEDIGRKYEIKKNELVIGRGETCDIFVDDEDVSRNHARVEVMAESILLTDLGSTNGTFVNGAKINEHRLADGDRIQIGSTTILKFNFLDNIEESFNEQLYNAANKDFLTQIYNKKYFLDRLRMEFSFSRRHESPLSLIIIDLDFFKQVNDRFGHVAGDYVLKELANQISAIKRQEDLFARFGGEEFVVLLRDTDKDTAIQIAEKFRSKVEALIFEFDQDKFSITISAGIATLAESNYKNYETFFRAADAQLLRAKKNGRNRVHFAMEGVSDAVKAKLGPSN